MEIDEEINIYDLSERIEELENNLLNLQHIIKFHGLDIIDRKYRKFNPKKGEYPFFTTNAFKKFDPIIKPLNIINDNEIYEIPSLTSEEKNGAIERMKACQTGSNAKFVKECEETAKKNGSLIRQIEEALSASSQKPECTQD